MNVNRAEIISSPDDREAANLEQYKYPTEDGGFTGILHFRSWHHNKPMLLCYFDADDGNQYVLPAWWDSRLIPYSPKDTIINFADDVCNETRWKCTYWKNKKGFISWRTAIQIN